MSVETVETQLKLSGIGDAEKGLESLKEHAEKVHEAMGELKKMFLEVFAIEKIIEFGKESFKAFTDANMASAQLDATLTSTNNAVGLSREELNKLSEDLSKNSLYTTTAVTSMQSVLTTFTSIHEDVFPKAQQAIADLATKMHGDLQGAAVQVGKALQDPVQGITALRKVGVSFSDEQQSVIQKLIETGHAAEAQTMILKELNTEFGGSAEAAMKADPWGAFKKDMEETEVSVGKLINMALVHLIPVLKSISEAVKSTSEWLKEHSEVLKAVAYVVGISVAAFVTYKTVLFAMEAPMLAVAAAQWAINVAMSVNPVGLIIAGVVALGLALYECWKHFEVFRRVVLTTWETIKQFSIVLFDSLIFPFTTAYHAVMALNSALVGDFSGAKAHIKEIGNNYMSMVNDVTSGVKSISSAWNADYSDKSSAAKGIDSKLNKKGNNIASGALTPASDSSSVSGTKQVIINVSINKLVELLKIESANIKDGANTASADVARALLSAVNQFSASADI